MRKIQQSLPKARRSELITEELEGELLVYDRSSDKAHCLNDTAAFVWARCDGQTSVTNIAGQLEREKKTPVSDEVVWFALDQLESRGNPESLDQSPAGYVGLVPQVLLTTLAKGETLSVHRNGPRRMRRSH